MPRFPPRGPHGRLFPRFIGTIRHCDFLPAISPRFVSFVWRYYGITHFFAPGVAACGDDGPGVGHSVSPHEFSSVETTGSPKFLGNPNSRLHMFSDPGRPMRSRPRTERSRGPRCLNDEGADDLYLSGLNSMAFGLAVYVSRLGYPSPRKTRFQVLVRLS